MKRDWLTLGFGIVLVGAVVGLSIHQNVTRKAPAPEPALDGGTPAPTLEPVAPALDAKPNASGAPPPPPAGGNRVGAPTAKPSAPAAGAPVPAEAGVVLQIQSDVPGASVFLDREFVGATPLTLRGLTAGSKQLNVTATGHEGYAETIQLTEGTNRVNVEFQRVRLNASIPVVHRHAMGSCQGTLAASVKGITYDTSNKDDVFRLGFADLEEFEVDYLKKNLRVRRRAGKTWNFTNDSADALFVFHRDVNKAREKLATAR